MKIVFFTGAGISKESGIETFRDSDGLWNNYKVQDVATYSGWKKNKEMVLDFYNKRRKEMSEKLPNLAHNLIKELENSHEVVVITQNVDNLHEKAGSSEVIHLHGELNKARSTFPSEWKAQMVYDWPGDIKIGDKCEKGSQLRPHVVFFGENLNPETLKRAHSEIQNCDVCVVVGTSMKVSPACDLPFSTKEEVPIYYIDPRDIDFHVPLWKDFCHIQETATEGMKELIRILF
jgi:NAD-dependent deacetylase